MVNKARYLKILSAALLIQAGLFYATSRAEDVPTVRPLREFPIAIGPWVMTKEGYIDEETAKVLAADDTLTRVYGRAGAVVQPSLFVAYFSTQRTGKAPHSPKNCLPGSGWEPSREDFLNVEVPGAPQPIEVNRYVVAKGENQSVVLYWYQSRDRVIASEYEAKFWTVADAIRQNRTDTALVRVVVPILGGDEDKAQQVAVEFVQAFFQPLRTYLPA
jgi:EpsI family protein